MADGGPSETRIAKTDIEAVRIEFCVGNEFGPELTAVLMRAVVPVSDRCIAVSLYLSL
jgi:hypothetical protein